MTGGTRGGDCERRASARDLEDANGLVGRVVDVFSDLAWFQWGNPVPRVSLVVGTALAVGFLAGGNLL